MNFNELKEFLDAKVVQYNNPKFIESDPIQIPYQFTLKDTPLNYTFFLKSSTSFNKKEPPL